MEFIHSTEDFFFWLVATFFSGLKGVSHHLVEHLLTTWLYPGDTWLQVILFMKGVPASTVLGDITSLAMGESQYSVLIELSTHWCVTSVVRSITNAG